MPGAGGRRRRLVALTVLLLLAAMVVALRLFAEHAVVEEEDQTDHRTTTTMGPSRAQYSDAISVTGIALDGCKAFVDRVSARRDLPPTSQSPSHLPIPRLIHFIHAYDTLENPRSLCSVESALRQNPDHNVIIHATKPLVLNESMRGWIDAIDARDRLRVIEIDVWREFRLTPLSHWYAKRSHLKSRWRTQNLGNALRLALMWNYGGVYLDLDILMVNPLGAHGRSIAMENALSANNAVLSFPKGDPFIWRLMQDFVQRFDGYKWANNGVYKESCAPLPTLERASRWMAERENILGAELPVNSDVIPWRQQVKSRSKREEDAAVSNQRSPTSRHAIARRGGYDPLDCGTLNVAHWTQFFPLPDAYRYIMYEDAYRFCDLFQDMSDSTGFHHWNSEMKGDIKRGLTDQLYRNGSVLVFAMRAVCPSVFQVYSDEQLGITYTR